MNILITGGLGYIGSHAAVEFTKQGHNITIIDNSPTYSADELYKFWTKFVDYGHTPTIISANLMNIDRLKNIFSVNKFDCVMHFAGNIEVGESVKNPLKYYSNNVHATENLLLCMCLYNCPYIIFSSTAAVYNPVNKDHIVPFQEEDTENGICKSYITNPYGNSKLACENLIRDVANTGKINYTIFRYFNVAGANRADGLTENHQSCSHLIPNLVNNIKNDKPFFINGIDYNTVDGTCSRDYIHVNDIVNAHSLVLTPKKKNEIYNLGSIGNNYYTVKQVVYLAETLMNKKGNICIGKRREGDPDILCASASKFCADYGTDWLKNNTMTDIISDYI